jgi:archaellum biogenesis protein FlaJ (TadC family)
MAQVIFINTLYQPDLEERRKLELMQDKLHFTLIELSFATRNESPYQRIITKISYHEKFRKRWKLIKSDGAI